MSEQLVINVLVLVFSGGAAYGGVKAALNGTRVRQEQQQKALERIGEKLDRYHETATAAISELKERIARAGF